MQAFQASSPRLVHLLDSHFLNLITFKSSNTTFHSQTLYLIRYIDSNSFCRLFHSRLRQRGILIGGDGPSRNVLKIKPPLVVTKDDMKMFVEELEKVLTELKNECEQK